MISKDTAMDIALAYREVETAEKLLAEITDAMSRRETPDIRDAFGRHQGGLQLGVPSGKDSHRLFNVPWEICRPVIETHIAAHRAKIAVLTEKAKAEIAAGDWEHVPDDLWQAALAICRNDPALKSSGDQL